MISLVYVFVLLGIVILSREADMLLLSIILGTALSLYILESIYKLLKNKLNA